MSCPWMHPKLHIHLRAQSAQWRRTQSGKECFGGKKGLGGGMHAGCRPGLGARHGADSGGCRKTRGAPCWWCSPGGEFLLHMVRAARSAAEALHVHRGQTPGDALASAGCRWQMGDDKMFIRPPPASFSTTATAADSGANSDQQSEQRCVMHVLGLRQLSKCCCRRTWRHHLMRMEIATYPFTLLRCELALSHCCTMEPRTNVALTLATAASR